MGSMDATASMSSMDGPGAASLRSQAVQLLVSFMGGTLGAPYSASAFAQQALQLYSQGVPAAKVLGLLRSRQFAQSGGLLPVLQQQEVFQEVNKQLFARWARAPGACRSRKGLQQSPVDRRCPAAPLPELLQQGEARRLHC
jgi:hypothetical protein